jgi:hypothetical protein
MDVLDSLSLEIARGRPGWKHPTMPETSIAESSIDLFAVMKPNRFTFWCLGQLTTSKKTHSFVIILSIGDLDNDYHPGAQGSGALPSDICWTMSQEKVM